MRRNILITGASSGLGAEMARQFAAKGHNLALTARREDRLKALQDELTAKHPRISVVTHKLDVTDHEQVFEVFRAKNAGHLVFISSVATLRGLPRTVTTYAATKAAVATLAKGLQLELLGKPIKVSTIYPGYIRSELNEKVANTPLIVDTVPGVRAMVAAIEAERAKAYVPPWPWVPMARFFKYAPLPLLKRMV